jgi:hypothetical protein
MDGFEMINQLRAQRLYWDFMENYHRFLHTPEEIAQVNEYVWNLYDTYKYNFETFEAEMKERIAALAEH